MRSGPVKPKLVARGTGAPNSAWKRPIPNITADGIPSTLRPLLSYILWRLHERETYSFVREPLILISDDRETGTLAEKLGMVVQGFHSFSTALDARRKPETDAGKWGEVEREFGVGSKSEPSLKVHATRPDEPAASVHENDKAKPDILDAEVKKQEEVVIEIIPEDEEVTKLKIEDIQPEEVRKELAQEIAAPEKESQVEEPAAKENVPATPRAWADVVSNRTRPVQLKPTPPAASPSPFLPTDIPAAEPDSLTNGAPRDKAITIADWVQQVKAAGTEPEPQHSPPTPHRKHKTRKPKSPSPPPAEPPKPFRPILMQRTPNSSQVASDKAPSPVPTPAIEVLEKPKANANHTPSASISSAISMAVKAESSNTAPSAKAPSTNENPEKPLSIKEPSAKAVSSEGRVSDELENSEDEVIVFNPKAKRISLQQQAAKRISLEKPSVPKEQAPSPAEPLVSEKIVNQQEPTKEASNIEQPAPAQSSPSRAGPSKNHRQPKARAPVVIDPDAFGRDFASNPRPNHHVAPPRSHPRQASQQHGPIHPRPVSQHGMPSNGIHQTGVLAKDAPLNELSPQRPMSQHGPSRGYSRGGRLHPQQSRYSPNSNILPNGHNGYRPSLHNGIRKPNGYGSAGENGSSDISGSNGQPSVLAKSSPQQEPQPDKAGPDVDFVLKSGSIRGSTRGRGRLFIP